MKENLEDIQTLAKRKLHDDTTKANQLMFMHMDWMDRLYWNLPKNLQNLRWIRKSISTDPHDALRDGTRLFASHMPKLKITALGPGEQNNIQQDRLERALKWHLANALRRKGRPQSDIILHAMKYDRIAAQVVYLPNQISAHSAFAKKPLREEHAARYGPYALLVRDPQTVFPFWSDYMLEGVLTRNVMKVHEVLDFWGDEAKKLKRKIGTKKWEGMEYVTVYDYWDFDQRMLWVIPQERQLEYSEPDGPDAVVILNEENKLPFIPWVIKDGGDELKPLLYSVYKAGQWDDINIMDSIMMGEIISYAAAPRLKISGPAPESVDVKYGEPTRQMELKPGHDAQEMNPPQFDQNLAMQGERIRSAVSKSTLPALVQQADVPSGAAFASIREMVQLGIKALNPYKELAESAFEEIFRQMLYWVDYSGETVTAYPKSRDGAEFEQVEIGAEDDFDVNNLYFTVELTPDLPVDNVARANGAIMMQELGMSRTTGLEAVGVEDTTMEREKQKKEELADAQHEADVQRILMQPQLEMQQEQLNIQMQAEQAAQQAAQEQEQPPGGALNAASGLRIAERQQDFAQQRNTGQGFENLGGLGFDPASGGEPPQTGNPEGTRETQQGRNR